MTDMEYSKLARPPLWVFGVLFLAYTGAHLALLLFFYSFAPSTPYLLTESVAIAGGVTSAVASLLAWRHTIRPERRKGIGRARPGMIRTRISRLATMRLTAGRSPSRSAVTSRR